MKDEQIKIKITPYWMFKILHKLGLYPVNTTFVCHPSTRADQPIALNLYDSDTLTKESRKYVFLGGLTMTLDQARQTAQRINLVCDQTETWPVK